ncbi:DEAD/DEAH box helicase, partial [Phenylobacterium sp.]|uniref:helicase-related protein n=1 Tax=Phenylobacterium sp. TaxID=1871053 RepID=UPI002733D717
PKKQTLFFSATMPPEITRLTKQFLNDPVRIEASRPAQTAETIKQHIARVPSSDPKAKRTALRALVGRADVKNGIVFCNRKSEVDVVAKSLKTHGFDAAPIHGDLDQQTRMRTLESFRKGELRLLVASDVAARGLDIPAVSHVFNYDVPHHADDYVHRIGRTGRAGLTGDTYMIVTPADGRQLDKVLKLIGMAPDEVVLDVDWSQIKEEGRPARAGRSGGSERPSRERGGRSRRPEQADAAPVEDAQPAVSAEPVAESAPAETSEAPRRPRGRRSAGRDAGPREVATAEPQLREASAREAPVREASPRETPVRESAEREARAPRRQERDRERPRRDRDDDDRSGVVGFGADTPAFLMRPPTRPASED